MQHISLGQRASAAGMEGDGRIGRKRNYLALRTRHVRACRQARCQRRMFLHHLRLPRHAHAGLRQAGRQGVGARFCVTTMQSALAVSSRSTNRFCLGGCKRMRLPCRYHACIYGTIAFCLVFSKNFNIMSALFVHQSPTLPQKIDSRKGLF